MLVPETINSTSISIVKFIYSEKATKFEKMYPLILTLLSQNQRDFFSNFCGLLRKPQLYLGYFARLLISGSKVLLLYIALEDTFCC